MDIDGNPSTLINEDSDDLPTRSIQDSEPNERSALLLGCSRLTFMRPPNADRWHCRHRRSPKWRPRPHTESGQ